MKSDDRKTKAELIAELNDLRDRLENEDFDRYHRMVMDLPQIVYEISSDGKLIFANTYALKSFGFTQKDIEQGIFLHQVIHPDSQIRAKTNVALAMQGQPSHGEEYIALRKDGSSFPIKVFSQGIFKDGKPTGVRGVVIDITDIKDTEEALLTSEKYYRALFDNTGTAMTLYGEDAIIRSWNTQFEILSGYSADEVVGKKKWTDFVDPDDLERMKAYHEQRLKEDNKAPTQYEFTFLARNGVRKRVHVIVKLVPGTDDRICSLLDITDRVEAEEALRDSQERYQMVARGANDGIWDWDIKTDNVFYSARYKEILGYTDEEFPNKAESWLNAVHPDDLKHTLAENKKCIEGKVEQFQVEYRMLHKDRSYRWILGRGAGAKDADGKVYRLAGTHTDITDRKVNEQALRENEERFRNIFEYATDGIYQCTPEGQFLAANAAIAKYLGYDSPEELIDTVTNPEEQMWVNPEDRAVFLKKLAAKGSLQNYEQHIKRKDGTKIWVSENVRAIFNDDGGIAYYEGFLQDITTRKLHESTTHALYAISKAISTTRDLQDLYQAIHNILHELIDATNFFIAILDEEEDRLSFTYFEDEKDEYYDIRNVSDPDTRSLTVHVLRTGESLLISNADPAGPELEESIGIVGSPAAVWLGVPLKVRGKIIGAMAVQHYTNPTHYGQSDVTLMEAVSEQVALAIERKTNEEALTHLNEDLESKVDQRTAELQDKASELEAANKRLRDLDEIKSSLVSSISHELRTPLTSIRGFAKLTGRDFVKHFQPLASDKMRMKKGERIRQNLDIIETEGERLTRLINDFLDINRIESGKAAWNDRFLNPCDIIKQAANAVSGSYAAKPELDLLIDLPKTVPPIHADPDKIQQILINLLNNACKFTSEGAVTVSATANVDTLTVTVADTGTGISKDELPYIFDKFHKSKLGDTISVKDKGTGLGLAICKEIVEHYGGSIWVESTLDIGSSFSFTLPSVAGTETSCI